jgi:hypothetical protein
MWIRIRIRNTGANHVRVLLQSLPQFNSNFPFQITMTERANHARDL